LDCGGGSGGLFCAEGVCQGAPRGYFAEVPRTIFARTDTATVRIRVDRAHGGAAAATASLRLNGHPVDGIREADGRIRFDVPLQLASPGVEAAVPFEVAIHDDLGHETTISEALSVDDLPPRLFIDADTVPSRAVLRGSTVQLRAHVVDGTGVTLSSSPGVAVTPQIDGSYLLVFDTRTLDPAATLAQVALGATDVAGNASSISTQFAVTRVRWQFTAGAAPFVSVATAPTRIVATEQGPGAVVLDRATGLVVTNVNVGAGAVGNLANEGTHFYTARVDGKVSSFDLAGTARWTCGPLGSLNGSLALGLFSVAGQNVFAAIVAADANALATPPLDQRFYAVRDDLALLAVSAGSCTASNGVKASSVVQNFQFDRGAPVIALDGTIYSGAAQALVTAPFDGISWGAIATAATTRVQGQPALVESAPGVQNALVSGTDGHLDSLSFPGARMTGFPVQASFVAISAPTIAEDGTIVVGSDDPRVIAISSAGTVRWRTTISARATTPPTHGAGGALYVGTTAGIVALQLQDGKILWTFATRGAVRTPPALGCDGVLYFGDDSGAITALQTDSAALADSPWPRGGHDDHGTGDARHLLRATDGSCVE
jgi:outer membrane protein assembly factor BamB